jgi:hypothetical protein
MLEISRGTRSPWWVCTSALGQAPETTVIAYEADESKGVKSKLAAYLTMMSNRLAQVSLDD